MRAYRTYNRKISTIRCWLFLFLFALRAVLFWIEVENFSICWAGMPVLPFLKEKKMNLIKNIHFSWMEMANKLATLQCIFKFLSLWCCSDAILNYFLFNGWLNLIKLLQKETLFIIFGNTAHHPTVDFQWTRKSCKVATFSSPKAEASACTFPATTLVMPLL